MSLFGALNTVVSGLSAQSVAFGNISDNVANSQTVGYKGVNTNFIDYLTTSTNAQNNPGAVTTRPDYTNSVQGTITSSSDPTAMAIAGQGFFAVSETDGTTAGGQPTFSQQSYYTRAGDFSMDKNGYLVNSAGDYLNGWNVDPTTGIANQSQLVPIQVNQAQFQPVPTTAVSLSANLPSTPDPTQPVSSQVQVYDSLGTMHTLTLNWTQTAPNDWTVNITSPDAAGGTVGTAEVKFGAASGNGVADGTIGGFGTLTGGITGTAFAAGGAAALTLSPDFGQGPQSIQLGLGTFGTSSGLSQYAGTSFSLRGLSQNGVPAGSFTDIATKPNGDIAVNYDNGQSRVIAHVPVILFNNPDALQRQNGQAFTATADSGTALAENAGSTGAGTIVTSSVEGSNVDIATEFSKLIIAQQAYGANAKLVTTADDMLSTTVAMKR